MLARRLLIVGSGGSFEAPEDEVFHGVKAYHSAAVAWADGAVKPFPFNGTEYDTDAYHFTSSSNLTGTVAKTATSTTITGSGTAFTTELTVNQAIAIPGTATEIGIVRTIASNTSLTLWQTMANSASGQTGVRRNDVLAVPEGRGGYYRITGGAYVSGDPAQDAPMYVLKNGPGQDGPGAGSFPTGGIAAIVRGSQFTTYTAQPNSVGGIGHVHGDVALAEGDYVQIWLYLDNDGGGGSFNIGYDGTSAGTLMWASLSLVGT